MGKEAGKGRYSWSDMSHPRKGLSYLKYAISSKLDVNFLHRTPQIFLYYILNVLSHYVSWTTWVHWCPQGFGPWALEWSQAKAERWGTGECVCFIQDGGGPGGKPKIKEMTNRSPLKMDSCLFGMKHKRNFWKEVAGEELRVVANGCPALYDFPAILSPLFSSTWFHSVSLLASISAPGKYQLLSLARGYPTIVSEGP